MPAVPLHGAALDGAPIHNMAPASRSELEGQREGGGSRRIRNIIEGHCICLVCGLTLRDQERLVEHVELSHGKDSPSEEEEEEAEDNANPQEPEEICNTAGCRTVLTLENDPNGSGGLRRHCAYHRELSNAKVGMIVQGKYIYWLMHHRARDIKRGGDSGKLPKNKRWKPMSRLLSRIPMALPLVVPSLATSKIRSVVALRQAQP
jgi:hypothetical protein